MKAHQAMLEDLLEGIEVSGLISAITVTGITADSRDVKAGDLFIALKGYQVDGRAYIETAFAQGAVAVLHSASDQPAIDSDWMANPNVMAIEDLTSALSLIAARFYQHPSRQLAVVGITGTNGKTTVANCLAQVFEHLGRSAGVMGTLGVGRITSVKSTGMTTLDAINTQKQLASMLDSGVDTVCMEVSSHGLALGRVSAVKFEIVVLTNLSQDHLDFHGTMVAYAKAKQQLFEVFDYRIAILNIEDAFGKKLIDELDSQILSFGQHKGDITARKLELTKRGIDFCARYAGEEVRVNSRLIGEFNVYNLLCVLAIGIAMDYTLAQLATAIEKCESVPGRMERVENLSNQPVVVIDYAHTPDALEKALSACRAHCEGSLSVVFGCGGDRDKGKRPLMGKIAEIGAEQVFITDDNPRSESPAEIVKDILSGMQRTAWVLHDRAHAIGTAIAQASANDWVLVAGKGHETRQQYADHSIETNDCALAQQALERVAA